MITRSQLSRSEKSSKINYVHSKLCTLSKYIPLFRDIAQPAESFIRPNILWQAQNFQ